MYHRQHADTRAASPAPATFTLDAVVQLLSSSEATPRYVVESRTARAIRRYLGRYFDSARVLLVDPPEIVRALRHKFVALKEGASARYAEL